MDLIGDQSTTHASVEAERCIVELQRGRGIALYDASNKESAACVFQLVETLDATTLAALMVSHDCQLVISSARAAVLGLPCSGEALCVHLGKDSATLSVQFWAGLNPQADIANRQSSARLQSMIAENEIGSGTSIPGLLGLPETQLSGKAHSADDDFAHAALNLAQQAHVLPALIGYRATDVDAQMLSASVQQAKQYQEQGGELSTLSYGGIHSEHADDMMLTVFKERHGHAEHVAITIGQPDFSKPVLVRLHSSCFTGDILGSLKCDCGEQLQRAIQTMADGDGGVVLYVSQEGRGIGLSSKLLAYQLQDMGLDTIEANQQLGFTADERRYSAAVHMLEQLGIKAISLMTNNPLKIKALQAQGIDVVARTPSPATVNIHNARYLETKRTRAGHLASCST